MPPFAVAIEPLHEGTRRQAIALVGKIFPSQSLSERLSLRLIGTRWERVFQLFGIASGRFWTAMSGGAVVGTTGLYTMTDDPPGRIWLGWFCVDPAMRGKGVGKALLDFAAKTAAAEGHASVRLYTSTAPGEAAAQALYEREGYGLVRTEQPLLWRLAGVKKLIRERAL